VAIFPIGKQARSAPLPATQVQVPAVSEEARKTHVSAFESVSSSLTRHFGACQDASAKVRRLLCLGHVLSRSLYGLGSRFWSTSMRTAALIAGVSIYPAGGRRSEAVGDRMDRFRNERFESARQFWI